MSNCVFCNIVNHTQEADILYEDDEYIAFRDIKPSTKFHILIIPKTHIEDARSLRPSDRPILENLISIGARLVEENGLNHADTISGFHWPPFNSIRHLHLHYINPSSEMNFLSRYIFKPNTWWFVTSDYVLNKLKEEEQTSNKSDTQSAEVAVENSSHL